LVPVDAAGWQAWHSEASTSILRGWRGTWGSLALLALISLGCLWWRAWFPLVCVAGMAFGSIDLHSVWQAWQFAWQAWHLEASISILCGRRGIWQHRTSLRVAGVALMALGWLWRGTWLPLCVAGVAFEFPF